MKVLLAPTEDFIKRERTALSADAAAGSSVVLEVYNAANYSVNDYIVIGIEGSLTAELQQITAVGETTITVGTLNLNHNQDEPITQYRYNDRKFYGSLTGASGSFTHLSSYGSPAQIDVNNPQGTYLEYTGTEGYLYFCATYWNTTDSTETDIGDAAVALADESLRYTGIYAIRVQAGLTQNPYITDGRIEEKRKQAENEINSMIIDRYVLPLTNLTTQLPEVPGLIGTCCRLLAAGYLDYEEYGSEGQGVKWLGEARGILSAIRKGSQRLIGSDNNELQVKTKTEGPQGFPNSDHGHDRAKFSMNDLF